MERQVVSLFIGTNGFLDNISLLDVKRFEREVLEYFEVKHNNIFEAIKKEKDISKETNENIRKAVEEFLAIFKKSA